MATWTPTDLTNPEFVKTQLTPLDRSNALLSMTQNLTGVQSALARNQAGLAAAQELTNGPLSFGTVRDARRAAQEAQAAGAANAAALQASYEELQAQRSIQTANADRFLRNVQSGEEAIRTSQIAIANLEAAGAVPPGTNQFTPPPGYTQAINPPQEVPNSQNPNPTPTTTEPSVQNVSPKSVNFDEDGNAISTEFATEPLQEPPGTGDEFDGIDQQVADNENALQEPPQISDEEADELIRAAAQGENIENSEPASATGYGNDQAEFTTDSLGNTFKNGVLFRAAEVAEDPSAFNGLLAPKTNTQSQATQQDISNFKQKADWRVRLSLSPGATYLYNDKGNEGILLPLAATDGVIFPYTPAISVQYAASYDATELTHSNYKFFQYKSSSVDSISLTCDFTAQDTTEANYLLAVIHFFRSVTKMFYGQDQNPRNGTPPPLCYLSGLGAFQFDAHPLAITNFTYALPTDVDYIRAGATTTPGGVSKAPSNVPQNSNNISVDRLKQSGAQPGALAAPVQWAGSDGTREPTYVPTKMQITITAVPIITRNDISNNFSLKKYGTGALLQGTKRKGGGIW